MKQAWVYLQGDDMWKISFCSPELPNSLLSVLGTLSHLDPSVWIHSSGLSGSDDLLYMKAPDCTRQGGIWMDCTGCKDERLSRRSAVICHTCPTMHYRILILYSAIYSNTPQHMWHWIVYQKHECTSCWIQMMHHSSACCPGSNIGRFFDS